MKTSTRTLIIADRERLFKSLGQTYIEGQSTLVLRDFKIDFLVKEFNNHSGTENAESALEAINQLYSDFYKANGFCMSPCFAAALDRLFMDNGFEGVVRYDALNSKLYADMLIYVYPNGQIRTIRNKVPEPSKPPGGFFITQRGTDKPSGRARINPFFNRDLGISWDDLDN